MLTREAIERVIAELDDDAKSAQSLYNTTKDDWYKGVAYARKDAIKRLEEVLNEPTEDAREC